MRAPSMKSDKRLNNPRMNKNMKLASEDSTDLPTNIIETILASLPIRDAVRTAILSKRWRYLWADIPKLVFDDTLCQASAGNGKLDKTKLVFMIYQILLLHRGPIKEFTLSISELESCSEIDQVILYLSRKNVMEKFTLCIMKGEPYKVPSSLISCQKLTHLKLHSCVLELPSMIGGFSNLISLEFDEVMFTAEVLGKFISNCPLLEEVSLISSMVYDNIELDAPRLRFLHFQLELKSLFLKNFTPLVNVSILLKETPMGEYLEPCNMIQLFDRLPLIENLQIGYHFLACLAAGGVPYKLPTSLVHLKFLKLIQISFGELDEVSFALCLIRSSPNLENLFLEIENITPQIYKSSVLEILQAPDFSGVILNQLRQVTMKPMSGVLPELEFVKLLLAKSPNLEKMLIKPESNLDDEKILKMLTDMIKFERASPRAKIIFGRK